MDDGLKNKNWREKREQRFQQWLSPRDVVFPTREAEQGYKQRVGRFIDAIKLKEPDRVPVVLPIGLFPLYYSGISLHTAMYDYEVVGRAWLKFLKDFEMDSYSGPGEVFPGDIFDNLEYNLFKWPGRGLALDTQSYQFVESERMKPEDYDTLIEDPSNFMMKVFMAKSLGALKPLETLPSLTAMWGVPGGYITGLARKDVQQALQKLIDAGKGLEKWLASMDVCEQERVARGLPNFMVGGAEAPFDIIGDKMRGTHGILTDMFRRPEKLLEAIERVIPITLKAGINASNQTGVPISAFALHKGNDTFMSTKQFETFYWPSLKKVLLGLIDEGLVPLLFAEGRYMTRLDIITDLPKGTVIWWFEDIDMVKAKEIVGKTACIAGNLATSVLSTGTPADVKARCRELIDIAGPGGGYILAGGAGIDKGNPDNLHAIMDVVKEYGVYK